jgi:PIN domain nuclease of toxin-antitoxin system
MRILLDTQCWLWMTLSPERFSAAARALVEAEENVLYLSAASAWEIAIKHALGKLRLPEPPVIYVPARVAALGIQPLAIEHQHALHVARLPAHHRDPFDRLLVAQAQLDDLPILTADPLIRAYDVATIAAMGT